MLFKQQLRNDSWAFTIPGFVRHWGRSWALLGRSWIALEPLLAISGPVLCSVPRTLGRSWALVGRSWIALEPLLTTLGPFLTLFLRFLAALGSWRRLGCVLGSLGVYCLKVVADLLGFLNLLNLLNALFLSFCKERYYLGKDFRRQESVSRDHSGPPIRKTMSFRNLWGPHFT